MPTASADGASDESLSAFALSIFALIGVGVIADMLNWETNSASSAMAVAGMTPNGVALLRRRRRTGRDQEFAAMTHGDLARPPLLVVGFLAPALLLVDSIFGAVVGAIVAITIAATNGDASKASDAFGVVSLVFALPLTLLATYLLAQRAAHFLASRTMLWLAAAIALYAAMRLAVISMSSSAISASGLDVSLTDLARGFGILAPVMFFVSWLGKRRANATHSQFVAMRLFRRLKPDDRQATLELLGESVINQGSASSTTFQADTPRLDAASTSSINVPQTLAPPNGTGAADPPTR
jgi:hypothetical protein